MAGPAYIETAFGPIYTRDGQAFLRDRTGKVVTVAADEAGRLLEEDADFLPISAEDVAQRDVQIARSTLKEQAKTFAESAAAGAMDVPLIPVRAGLRTGFAAGEALVGPLPAGVKPPINPDEVTGRAAVEGLNYGLGGASGETEAEAVQRATAYHQAARERAEVNPNVATTGTLAGQLPWAFAGPAAGAAKAAQGLGVAGRLAAGVAGGVVEGAAYGESQATDDAFINDKPLTAEKLMASMGWGALLGGAAGLGGGLVSEGYGAIKNRVGRSAAREAVSDDVAIALGGAAKKNARTAAVVDSVDARIADAADSAGLNPAARRAAAEEEARALVTEAAEMDPTNWREFTQKASPEAQYLHRETVLNAASSETARDLTGVLERQPAIYNEIDNLQVKRGKIAEHLAADGVDESAVIGRAQQETAALKERIGALREEVINRQLELTPRAEVTVKPHPTRKGAQIVEQAPVKRAASSAEKALQELETLVTDHESRMLKASAGADAVAEYDSLRRELSKVMRRTQGLRPTAYEETTLLDMVRPFAFDEYNRAAQNLWDEGFVGKTQARAQKAVNNARVDSIAGERYDLRPFTTQVADEQSKLFGRTAYVGNQDNIRGMFAQLGEGGRGTRADQFARFVDSQEVTLQAIKDNYALSASASKQLDESLAALQKLRGSVSSATDAANAVNRARAIIESDQIAGGRIGTILTSTLLGGARDGVAGAARGFARGVLGGTGKALETQAALASVARAEESRLAAWLESKIAKVTGTAGKGAAVVNRTAGNVDSRVGSALDGYFARLTKAGKQAGPGAQKARPVAPAVAQSAAKLFLAGEAPQVAYRKRNEELLALNQNMGAGVRDRTAAVMGGVAETAPRLTQHVAVAATRGVTYLLANAPVPLRAPSALKPGYRPVPSDLEVAQFAKRWGAVVDPLTVIDDFQRGMVTYEQVDALKAVYPTLYQSIRIEALQRFAKLDAEGIPVPYQDRLQADLMFDLHGAGDPTLEPEFALKVSGMIQAAKQQVSQPPSANKPVNIAKSYASESQAIGATLRGAS